MLNVRDTFLCYLLYQHQRESYHNSISNYTDMPARPRGGGLLNGLNSDDLDDDDDYIDEESEEYMQIGDTGGSINRLGGQPICTADDSRHHSVLFVCICEISFQTCPS